MLYGVFVFGLDLWVVDVNDILAFGSRMMTFWHGGSLLSRSKNKSYLCIGLSLLRVYVILKLKTNRGLTN
jgi:hypothetical protein